MKKLETEHINYSGAQAMSAAFNLNIIDALRNPQHEARELEHTKITKQLERKFKKLNNQSKDDSLTLAEKIAIKTQAKPLAEQLHRHKLNFHTFVLDGPEGASNACLPE